jgi:ATP-dependent helicase Lhr and Lhr-like helicase
LIASRLQPKEDAVRWLMAETSVDEAGAEQLLEYIAETLAALGCIPSHDRVVAERFFDESGGMQLVLHAPFGARVNRAWGLALRKRFCVTFDFELQAAATDDGIVLSLGEQHSFPLESVFSYVRTPTLDDTLVQALLPSPMFTNRWRWNITRALALLRHSGGRRVPMPIQRMRAEDLLAAVFPEQVACQDNRSGPIVPPDHPLVNETIRDCLHEAMDLEGLRETIARVEDGRLSFTAVETPSPSPMSHEILNANPYAFLDDAPLEERRARAVSLRRTDPELAQGLGALDEAAIEEVLAQAWPDVRDADELHDHLLGVGILPLEDAAAWESFVHELMDERRVTIAAWGGATGEPHRCYVAAERLHLARAAIPEAAFSPEISAPGRSEQVPSGEEAVRTIVHAWMQCIGPTTARALAERLGLSASSVEQALAWLEGSGVVLRGRFTREPTELEWCERRLLARIHRLTIGRLRKEIEPVSAADLVRFLLRWQHVHPGTQLHGREGVLQVIGQLQGLELPAPAWEEHVFPARVQMYNPADLEEVCLSGMVAWGRLSPNGDPVEEDEAADSAHLRRRQGVARNTPIGFVLREDLPMFLAHSRMPSEAVSSLSTAAADVADYLEKRGASFLPEIVKGTGRMPAEVEDALWELVSHGLVSGDGVAGLRRLLRRNQNRTRSHSRLRALSGARAHGRPLPVGRWSLWGSDDETTTREERNEAVARQLLRRYGVVIRELLGRERGAPSWRILLDIYRRWEARGEIRGGRFVAGFVGVQFALPEAVEALRVVRREKQDEAEIIVSAADPTNLVGIILPGGRVSPLSGLSIAYRGGVAVDVAPLGTLRSHLWKGEGMAAGSDSPGS